MSCDSEELQNIFDAIAAEVDFRTEAVAAKPSAKVIVANNPDSEELQQLFDSRSSAEQSKNNNKTENNNIQTVDNMTVLTSSGNSSGQIYTRLGQMTRALHDAIHELGFDKKLNQAVSALPDAKERLTYITKMTEKAAWRVLNATDIAMPLQTEIQNNSRSLHSRWDKVFASELSVDEFKSLATETQEFLRKTTAQSEDVRVQLKEIMMAQDFQDLTGQMIKRITILASQMEAQLVELLVAAAPNERASVDVGLMNGPVINHGRGDVITNQKQVDELLGSLGF